ncbi:hypothetical protein [Pseudomonas sp. KNUC1026]|uniref:hypothetical protein n=1 Tax=Pseudomonas sp. KNUC1026 TaxID=2893890 RepID=UPI001F1B7B1B|nr:hypothetical protein [Pseudomonas sp. KNUC1026]UFH50761.1 hypothetical protein LN139_06450 [Pseudomonas sp. KNUC1026]
MKALLRLLACAVGGLLTLTLGFFAWQAFWPVQAAPGWAWEVAHDDVPKAAALVRERDGAVLISQELQAGEGSLLRIDAQGVRHQVLGGLSKPDGLALTPHGVAFSEEVGGAAVSLLGPGGATPLFRGDNLQHLWSEGDDLYSVEDRKGQGRLLRFRFSTGELEVLREGLAESEAVTRCAGGPLLYTEKTKGVVRQYQPGGQDSTLVSGLSNPTFLMCDARGLWISEDDTHRARLLLRDPQGQLHTVLSFLKAPQALLADGPDGYLLAEGGRDRVLRLHVE